ncbi:MAG: hypothetical protein ABL961_02895 [Vicinamibacterales bacterium]
MVGGSTIAEEAIARAVLLASVFDYPLTLAQLRRTLVASQQTATGVLGTWAGSEWLQARIEHRDGFFYPTGRQALIAERIRREARSRVFLQEHQRLLHLICALPYVDLVALSGSVAHMNLEEGGDLDLFIVTRGRHVWSVTVAVIILARLMGRRRTLCANYVVADTALSIDTAPDPFTASQIVHLKPLVGEGTYLRFLDANPFVRAFYPNMHGAEPSMPRIRQSVWLRGFKRCCEWMLAWPAAGAERLCRWLYRAYLKQRADTWTSPEQVRLDDDRLKLHTHSHRQRVMQRFERARHEAM